MARSKSNSVVSVSATVVATPTVVVRAIDLLVPIGFVVAVDPDLSLKDGERPSKARLDHAMDTMAHRHEEAILKALRTIFGERVSFIEAAEAYTGDPKTGIAKKIHLESAIPGTPVAPVVAPITVPVAAPAVADEIVPVKAKTVKAVAKKAKK